MGAPSGNQFWRQRSKHGRDTLFASADLLWESATEYFKWCDENPLYESKAFAFQGMVTQEPIPKMRAYTLTGLCLFLGCNTAYFRQFKSNISEENKDFSTVISQIEETIETQQFTGAAAELLNPNIIARSLGLVDKKEHDVTTKGESLNKSLTPDEARQRLEMLMNGKS